MDMEWLTALGSAFVFPALLIAAIAYFCGCFNGAVIVSKYILRDDIRNHGSGNAGMTNTLRTYGKLSAALVLAGDAAKGALAAWIGLELGGPMTMYMAGLFAVIGHMFPVFFGFRGGKGVATAAGFILGSQPFLCLILAVVFALVVFFSRYVSLGSCWAGASFPFATWFVYHDTVLLVLAVVIGGLILYMHRGNIHRLLTGTENKFSLHHKKA